MGNVAPSREPHLSCPLSLVKDCPHFSTTSSCLLSLSVLMLVVLLCAGRGSSQMGGGNQQDDGWTAVGDTFFDEDPFFDAFN